ncbi:TrmB family transcriptional regulator [bacterium]|nr:TrmB family transcriptional regulator [bacterium]
MQQIISLLQELGFSQYEAQAYFALLQQSNVTGYELAKNSGIPASKIYPTLNKLVDKDVVVVVSANPKKYLPKPPDEILSRFRNDYLGTVDSLSDKLNKVYSEDALLTSHIWNLTDYPVIIEKLREFVDEADATVYLSVWDEELDAISDTLGAAAARGVDITTVHFGAKRLGIGKEYHHGGEHYIRLERGGRRITLIIDDDRVILAHFRNDGSCDAVWTANSSLVLLAKDYITHDIYTIRIHEQFGEKAEKLFEKV